MNTRDIGFGGMLIIYGMLAVPVLLAGIFKLGLVKETLISVLRMSVQLFLVGLYLKVIFDLNSFWVNGVWLMVMLTVANVHVLKGAGLRVGLFFLTSLASVGLSTLITAGVLIGMVLRPLPLFDARYLIPVTGMVLGNCLRGNIVSLERFYSGIRKNEEEFLTYILLGAKLKEAILPYLQDAVKAALKPTLATMATIGIVALPGMMTGQMLGGSLPIVAIKYQIAIMIAIFTAVSLGCVMNILFSLGIAFRPGYKTLDPSVFAGKGK